MITLDNLVKNFLYNSHKFFKHTNLYGNSINKEFAFDNYDHYIQEYLGFFKDENSLKDVLSYACCGVFKIYRNNQCYLIRHNHQEYFKGRDGRYRGLPLDDGKFVARIAHERINEIKGIESFDDLYNLIRECSETNANFGLLSAYDAAVRTGAFLGLKPDFVYIHTGVRAGVTILEELGYTGEQLSNRLYAPLKDFPSEMQIMTEIAAENFSCTDKDRFKALPRRVQEERN